MGFQGRWCLGSQSANLINYNHKQFKLMLRNNHSILEGRQPAGSTDIYQNSRPSQTNIYYQRPSFKENQKDYSPSFNLPKHTTETSDTTAMSSRLQSIRKKYDYQNMVKDGRDYPAVSMPLEENKNGNKITNKDYRNPYEKETAPQLHRSFSFINNKQHSQAPTQSIGSTDWRISGAQAHHQITELRKNSSYGFLEDPEKYKYQGKVEPRYTQQDRATSYLQPVDNKITDYSYKASYRPRVSSEYTMKIESDPIARRPTFHNNDGPPNSYLDQPRRLESIDKINIKINQIMQCIGQNEKACRQRSNSSGRRLSQGQIHHQGSPVKKSQIESKHNHSVSQSNIKRSGIYSVHKTYDYKIPTEVDQVPKKLALQEETTKEYYAARTKTSESITTSKSTIMKNKDYDYKEGKLSRGRDLDQEIRKIQEKIKKSEEEKVRLNLQFENDIQSASYKMSDIKSGTLAKNKASCSSANFNYQRQTQSRTLDKVKVVKPQKPIICETNSVGSQEIKITVSNPSENHVNSQESQMEPFKLRMLHVQSPIEEEPISARQSKRFIDNLRQQVRLDEELRNAKIWLESSDQVQNKWESIQETLKMKGIDKNIDQIQQQFKSTLQEHNPFHTAKDNKYTIESLVEKYTMSQNYWEEHILNCFDSAQLKNENFTEDKIDLEKKGYLTVEDFVRFLNIETGTFYRNRDLTLIFRRFASDRLEFNSLLSAITKS